jgi:enoyl-CoA hydratase/carnithine racemase
MLIKPVTLVKRQTEPYYCSGAPTLWARPGQIDWPAPKIPEKQAEIRYDSLDYRRDGPVATVTLARPESGNRIDSSLAAELREACRAIGEDEGIRSVIITGAGSVFSVGREPVPEDLPPEARLDWLRRLQVASTLAGLPVPVIAAVNGNAQDHGLELALAADLRIASTDASFGFTDLAQCSFPWDGGTQRLPRLVGPAWARDVVLTGRIIDATQAMALGLVSEVVAGGELPARARRLAETVAAGAPIAARYAKEAIGAGMDLTLAQGLRLEADLNILLQSTADRAEGIQSYLQRREPEFRGG